MAAKLYTYLAIALLTLAVLLIGFRLALPSMVENYLNDKLIDLGDYTGQVSDVDIHLWRGTYAINELQITHVNEAISVPLFQTEKIDISISWSALLQGRVEAELDFYQPEIHYVDLGREESGEDAPDWQQKLQDTVPIDIDKLSIHDGQIHFHNYNSDPMVHLVLYQLNGNISNLNNADRSEGLNFAQFEAEGLVLDIAMATFSGQADPLSDFHNFELNLKVTGIELPRMNDLAEAYGNFDFQSGTGDFIMELEAKDAELTGYAKPLLDNVEVLDLEKDLQEGIFSATWEAVVGFAGQVFRNQPKDRIATEIQIRGNLDQQDVSVWQAFVSILRNAFIDAYEVEFKNK